MFNSHAGQHAASVQSILYPVIVYSLTVLDIVVTRHSSYGLAFVLGSVLTLAIWITVVVKTFDWCTSNPTRAVHFFQRTSAISWLFPLSGLLHSQALKGCGKLVEAQVVEARSFKDPILSMYAEGGDLTTQVAFRRVHYDEARTDKVELKKLEAAINLGYALLLSDDCSASLEFSEEALKLIRGRESTSWRSPKVHALINCARAKIRILKLEEGERLLDEVLDVLKGIKHECARGELQLALAELRLRQGRLEEAKLYALIAVDEYKRKSGSGTLHSVYSKQLLASILHLQGRSAEAADLVMSADLEEDDMIRYNQSMKSAFLSTRVSVNQKRRLIC